MIFLSFPQKYTHDVNLKKISYMLDLIQTFSLKQDTPQDKVNQTKLYQVSGRFFPSTSGHKNTGLDPELCC